MYNEQENQSKQCARQYHNSWGSTSSASKLTFDSIRAQSRKWLIELHSSHERNMARTDMIVSRLRAQEQRTTDIFERDYSSLRADLLRIKTTTNEAENVVQAGTESDPEEVAAVSSGTSGETQHVCECGGTCRYFPCVQNTVSRQRTLPAITSEQMTAWRIKNADYVAVDQQARLAKRLENLRSDIEGMKKRVTPPFDRSILYGKPPPRERRTTNFWS